MMSDLTILAFLPVELGLMRLDHNLFFW